MAGLNIRDAVRKWGPEYLAICGLSHYFPEMKSTSRVFWVEGNLGDDDAGSLGQNPHEPLKSITKALEYCTDGGNDYIFVANVYAAEAVYPIQIAKSFVHIIGAWGVKSPMWIHPDAYGDVAAIEFVAGGSQCELANLELGGGATAGGILVSGNACWANYIHDCRFGMCLGMGAKHGIISSGSGELINWIIEKNRFGILLTDNAIELAAGGGSNPCKGTIIRNNQFQVDGSGSIHAINLEATQDLVDGGIYDNRFEIQSESEDGAAVYFVSGAKGNVHNNYAWGNAGIALAHNPYYDAGTTGMSFGMNFRGAGEVATDTLRAAGTLATPTNI